MSPFAIILSAPSGGGKTTIAKTLLSRRKDLGYSVSCTTRAPRGTEVDGRHYYFISRAEFLAKREENEFAESFPLLPVVLASRSISWSRKPSPLPTPSGCGAPRAARKAVM